MIGFQTRLIAWAMAAFTLMTVVFHNDLADQNQRVHFLKNLSIAAGLL
ncbi:hypothetical protein [Pseudomonas sp. Marseille-QA0892]